ncbi:MAG: thiol-disulfide oxidoreductase DCC family protein [Aureispira sp.]
MKKSDTTAIVLFDGVCNLCDRSVQFIIKHDPKGRYKFAPLQSDFAKKLLQEYQLDGEDLERAVLIENGKAYTHSSASLRVTRHLSGAWPLLYGFIIIPRFIRNAVYRWVARNRYRWFGQKDNCVLPSPENRARFLANAEAL